MILRRITSLTVSLSFCLSILTSIILFIVPHGRIAYWSDWHLWGMTKTQWGNLHINLGLLFLIYGGLHLYYNWAAFLACFKNRTKRLRVFTGSFNVALLVVLAVGIGTFLETPPFIWIPEFSGDIKEAAARKYGEPPYGHAELSSLELFARNRNLDLERSILLLKEADLRVSGPQQTLKEIGRLNGIAPKEVYDLIRPAASQGENPGLPESPPLGFGIRPLKEAQRHFQFDLPRVIKGLAEKGIKATPEMSVKDIAAAQSMSPPEVYEILRQADGKL